MSQAQTYLKNKNILILDKSSTSRQLIEKALIGMGVDKGSIFSLKSYQHAVEFIKEKKPNLIFTDFQIHDSFGLDLIGLQSQLIPDHSEKIFIVVTETAKDSAVTDAAEEEVDGYILKPFTIDFLSNYLQKIIEQKLIPNHYQEMLSRAKALLNENKMDDAILHFEMALNLSAKPSLALYYLGEISRKKGDVATALHYYRQGQKITPLHFRCIVAEFMTLFEQQKFDEAHKVLSKITLHYPMSPKLLKSALALSVYTYKFDDVERYYMSFLELERKTKDLKQYISSAMLEAGKNLLQNSKIDEALDYFLKGSVISGKRADYLHTVIDAFIENGQTLVAETYLSMFLSEELSPGLFKQLHFKINSHRYSYDKVIEEGKMIIGEGYATTEIYEHVFGLLRNTQHKQLLISLVHKAIDQYPEKKGAFVTFLPK